MSLGETTWAIHAYIVSLRLNILSVNKTPDFLRSSGVYNYVVATRLSVLNYALCMLNSLLLHHDLAGGGAAALDVDARG